MGNRRKALLLSITILTSWSQPAFSPEAAGKQAHLETLKQIYLEVKELGTYPGEDFNKGEFFVGADDDDTNKDIHVFILIHKTGEAEKMKIQVTYMVRSPGALHIRFAKTTKSLICIVAGEKVEIERSEFEEKELKKLAPGILQAILDKKKLLRLSLCGSGRPGSPDWPGPHG